MSECIDAMPQLVRKTSHTIWTSTLKKNRALTWCRQTAPCSSLCSSQRCRTRPSRTHRCSNRQRLRSVDNSFRHWTQKNANSHPQPIRRNAEARRIIKTKSPWQRTSRCCKKLCSPKKRFALLTFKPYTDAATSRRRKRRLMSTKRWRSASKSTIFGKTPTSYTT